MLTSSAIPDPFDNDGDPIIEFPEDELPTPRRGQPVLAWIVILILVGGELLLPVFLKSPIKDATTDLISMEMQARSLIVSGQWMGNKSNLYLQAQVHNTGSIGQRLRFIVLAGELSGAAEAKEQLTRFDMKMIEHERTLTPEETTRTGWESCSGFGGSGAERQRRRLAHQP